MTSYSINKRISNGIAFIKQALYGPPQDFTQGSIRRAVFLLAIPMILEMMMESVFALVDIYFVGRLGNGAVATVALTESVVTSVYSIAIGLSMAATATVARRIGEKDPDAAAKSGVQAILISMAFSLIISIAGLFFAGDILRLMGADPNVVHEGTIYTRILFGGSTVIMLLFLINGIFRGAGDAAMAMKSLWLANLGNIILCPLLINGLGPIPALGLKGAAIATTVGRGMGVVYQCYHLFKGKGILHILKRHFLPDMQLIKSLLTIAWTGTLQFLIGSASWIVLARIVAKFGTDVVAGYQVAIRIVMFFLLPAWGLSNAAATLVGQNLGAQQPQRAEKSVWQTAKYNALFMLAVTALFFLCGTYIVRFINKDINAEAIAIKALAIVSIGYVFYGVGMVMISAFNGAGDTKTPTYINLFGFWMLQVPVAYILSIVVNLGPEGVFIAIPVAESAITIIATILFTRGKWKTVKV
ncbi:MATE family efflux transporter [Danxiaibacter flavus]|uniref:Multidrug-efflux transporter n=1 Tax=Danxiaibacter flavus TaxID=3049108 RepID=A0ABV3ZFJ5_9BACT|nr:MATE family efflux transporter [Chitinophagaceae bacterium DXS]